MGVGVLVCLATGPFAQADEVSPPLSTGPAPATHAAPYTGPLQRPRSATYYALRSPVPVRSGPDASSAVVSEITTTAKPLQALGQVFDGDPQAFKAVPEEQGVARTWIKLRLPGGGSGFVNLADLVTSRQLSSRAGSSKKVALLEAAVAAAKRIKGAEVPSGVYSQGGSCDVADASAASFLPGKFLIWQDGNHLHFVNVLQPDDPIVYDIANDNQVRELQGFGYVPMRTYRSTKDAVLMGYKDRLLWVTTDGNRFNSYQACDPEAADAVVTLLRSYATQRPPEAP